MLERDAAAAHRRLPNWAGCIVPIPHFERVARARCSVETPTFVDRRRVRGFATADHRGDALVPGAGQHPSVRSTTPSRRASGAER